MMMEDVLVSNLDRNRERLNQFMEERRAELGLTWEEVAARSHLAKATIGAIRAGQPTIRTLTQRALEQGLDWAPGSIRAVLQGGQPAPAGQRQLAPPPTSYADMVDSLIGEILGATDVTDERKHQIVLLIRQAEAELEARLRAARDEIRFRNRSA